ncbi:MAG TPA: prepilin peptidase [Vicinamibacteria bacterium]|nr:prepilin peptidase [Vicinamibacteria bacterium]
MTAPSLDLRLLLESPAFEVAAFTLGLVVGSFANVCVHRLPLGLSVVSPPSRCPSCGALIAPYDNVPVVGWLVLRGRCRSCRNPISVRYPAVEMLNGLLYLGVALLYGPSLLAVLFMVVSTALVVLALIDLDHQLLPDAITLPGMLLGLVAAVPRAVPGAPERWLVGAGGLAAMAAVGMTTGFDRRRPDAAPGSSPSPDWSLLAMVGAFLAWQLAATGTWNEAAAAAALGYLLMAMVAKAAARYYGQEALGEGDWKMAAMLGALFGWQGMLLSLFVGTLGGALIGLLLVALGRGTRRMKIPLGTFLALGGLVVIFAGAPVLAWYRGLYRG